MLKQETFRQGGEKLRALTTHSWASLVAILVGDVTVLFVPTELPLAIATVEMPPQVVAYRAALWIALEQAVISSATPQFMLILWLLARAPHSELFSSLHKR